jgi:hypothetical protein
MTSPFQVVRRERVQRAWRNGAELYAQLPQQGIGFLQLPQLPALGNVPDWVKWAALAAAAALALALITRGRKRRSSRAERAAAMDELRGEFQTKEAQIRRRYL